MAGFLSISSPYLHVSSHSNRAANFKAFFVHGFIILTADFDLLNKWVIHRFNIYVARNIKDYKLWACIKTNFKKFKAKYFNILDSSTYKCI